ncbi:hypothetical protein [Lyticum sinuosum]|uniref:Uncharacterized protein n=1 Tax=Lyticum sinuosum TaxID=1332059 RepID=A0AAE4VMC3_9RICK|nr:hypothetical protein [Lyticum sinuosum]MDZ5761606.1 hypothetical protein [Lyticum sinuosum]
MTIKILELSGTSIGGIIGITLGIAIINTDKERRLKSAIFSILAMIIGVITVTESKKFGYDLINILLTQLDKNIPQTVGRDISNSLAFSVICSSVLLISAIVTELVMRGIEGIKNLHSRYKSSAQQQQVQI